jgi:hypothetical protein
MQELGEYLPVRLRIYKSGDGEDAEFDEVVLAEITDVDEGLIEVRFQGLKGRQFYVAFRQDDLRKELATVAEVNAE